MKKTIYFLSYLSIGILAISSCTVMSNYQSAKTVGQGNIEVTGSLTNYGYSSEDLSGSESFSYNSFGFQGAYGISDKLDAGVRFERVSADGIGLSHLAFSTKYQISENMLSLYVPVGIYFGEDIEVGTTLHLRPTFLGNFDISDRIELTPSLGYAYALDSDQVNYIQLGVGSGININDNFSLRPEIGYSIASDAKIFNAGIGVIYKLD